MMAWRALLLFCAGLACTGLAAPGPVRADIGVAQPALADAAAHMTSLGLAFPQAPLTPAEPSAFVHSDGAILELVDLRFLLARLAAQTGAKDHGVLIAAQPDGASKALLLRGGHVSLRALAALAQSGPAAAYVQAGPQGVTLTRPLAIWSDAGLGLARGDRLALDRAAGSFLITFGGLNLTGASITGTPGTNPRAPMFRPFALSTGAGHVTLQDSRLSDLGFGASGLFGGLTIAPTGLAADPTPVLIRASRFSDVLRLTLLRTEHSRIADTEFTRTALLLSGTRHSRITGNQFDAAAQNQTLRVSAGFSDVIITANSFAALGTTAIAAQDGTGLQIIANQIEGQVQNGLTLDRVACAHVANNLIAGNGANGIALRNSAQVTVSGNALLGNDAAGLYLRDQAAGATTDVAGNVIAGNGVGLRGASTGALTLSDNQMQGQFPRLFSGDLAQQTVAWLKGTDPATPPAPAPASAPAPACLTGGAG